MGNPKASSENEKIKFVINCIIAVAPDLINKISMETPQSGSKDNNLGVKIDTVASNHECGYDPKTKEGIRIVKGKKIKANSKIMKKSYDIYNKRNKEKEER